MRGIWTPLLFAGCAACAAPPADWRSGSLAGGEEQRIEVVASVAAPRLLLVEQSGIDLQLECLPGAVANAPTGRWGFEAALIEADTRCSIRPKMAKAVRGRFRWTLADPDARLFGLERRHWRLYAGLLLLDDQREPTQRAEIAGLRELLAAEGLEAPMRLQLELGLANLLRRVGQGAEARAAYQRARSVPGVPAEWWPTLHNGEGQAALAERQLDLAERAFERARQAAREVQDPYEIAVTTNNLCLVQHYRRELRAADQCFRRASALYRAAGEFEQLATPLYNWAILAQELGDPETALHALREALQIREQGPYDRALGNVHLQLALMYSRLQEWRPALQHSLRATEVFDTLAEPASQARAWRVRSIALQRLGQNPRACQAAARAATHAARARDPRLRALVHSVQAECSEDPARAQALRLEARDDFLAAGDPVLARREELRVARALLAAGSTAEARALVESGTPTGGTPQVDALESLTLAELGLAEGESAAAARAATRALAGFQALRDAQPWGQSLRALARAELAEDKLAAARGHLDEALALARRQRAELPSPAQLAADRGEARALADLVFDWHLHGPSIDTRKLWSDLAALEPMPAFVGSDASGKVWREYRMRLAQLMEAGPGTDTAALVREIERIESSLELSFTRAEPPDVQDPLVLKAALAPDRALLRVVGGEQLAASVLLAADAIQAEIAPMASLQQRWTEALRSPPGVLYLASPEPADSVAGLPESTLRIDVVGEPTAEMLADRALPAGFGVALLTLPDAQGRLLPGVASERRWLQSFLAGRVRTIEAGSADTIEVPSAAMLHVAAHGWGSVGRPLAHAFVGGAGSDDLAFAGSLHQSQFRFASPVQLLLLSVCDAGQDDTAGAAHAQQLALATGALVVAPRQAIADVYAFSFARRLYPELLRHPPLEALRRSLDGDPRRSVWTFSLAAATRGIPRSALSATRR